MIKKLSLSILLAFTFILSIGINTRAEVGVISWNVENVYSTYYSANVTLDIPADAYKITFYVPESDYHVLGAGGINSYVSFKAGGVTIQEYDIPEIKGSQIFGTYELNLQAMGLYGQIDEIVIYIMQSWSVAPDFPEYVNYLNSNSELLINYNLPFDITVEWYSQYLFSNYYGVISTLTILDGTVTISLLLPESTFHEVTYNGIDASIEFYDATDTKLHTLIFDDYYDQPYIGGLHYFNLIELEALGFDVPTAVYTDIEYIKILIPQNYDTNIPSGYLDYLRDNSSITFNDLIKRVTYYTEGNVFFTELFDLIPERPSDPVKASSDPAYYFEFEGWYKADGTLYDYSPVKDDELLNNTFYLYAKYNRLSNVNYFPDDPTPNTDTRLGIIFTEWGWDVNLGYLLTFFLISIIVILTTVFFRLPAIITIIAEVIILSIFAFYGFLTLTFSIVLYMILTLAFLMILFLGGE